MSRENRAKPASSICICTHSRQEHYKSTQACTVKDCECPFFSSSKPAQTYPATPRTVPDAETIQAHHSRVLSPNQIQLQRINAQVVYTKEAAYHIRELVCEHPHPDQREQLLHKWQEAYDAFDALQSLVKRLG